VTPRRRIQSEYKDPIIVPRFVKRALICQSFWLVPLRGATLGESRGRVISPTNDRKTHQNRTTRREVRRSNREHLSKTNSFPYISSRKGCKVGAEISGPQDPGFIFSTKLTSRLPVITIKNSQSLWFKIQL
jgi:hypothetical protein